MTRAFAAVLIGICLHVSGLRAADYTILNEYPHDPEAYTQGLVVHAGRLYEGTGLYGHSEVREVDLSSGAVVRHRALPKSLFGEGVTVLDGHIYQLTWRAGAALSYRLEDFEPAKVFHYAGEGWGLTTDGTRLIMSDGSAWIRFIDPSSFTELDRVLVHDGTGPVDKLNELEYVAGLIYANVYQSGAIVEIEATSGRVQRRIDFEAVVEGERVRNRQAEVLNGIAYDERSNTFLVTGKRWSRLLEIRLD